MMIDLDILAPGLLRLQGLLLIPRTPGVVTTSDLKILAPGLLHLRGLLIIPLLLTLTGTPARLIHTQLHTPGPESLLH